MRAAALVLALLGGFALPAPAQIVEVYQTTSDLSQKLEPQPPLTFSGTGSEAVVSFAVNPSVTYQQIDGFGASFTDSSAWLIQTRLTPAQRDETMRLLFDPVSGIGLSFVRQPMGASDFALSHYSYDDMPAGETDPTLARFSIAHDEAYILPVLRQARALNPSLKIMASPWSPPGWMKTTGSLIKGSLLDSAASALANYFVKFVEAYEAEGVPIYAVTPNNEPLYEPGDYPGMRMEAGEQAAWIRDHLGPAFAAAGLRTKILTYDHNWDRPDYPRAVLSDPRAAALVAGTAYHCYGGEVSAQSLTHDEFPHKDIWETECSGGTWQTGNLLAEAASLIIGSTRHWARSVVFWNMALDQANGPHSGGCDTCRGVVTIDHSSVPARVTPTVDFYALGHASKFVTPGAHRIESGASGQSGLEQVAFRNPDGSLVLLVFNTGSNATNFDVRWEGKYLTATVAAGALVTYRWAPLTPPAVSLATSPSGLLLTAGEAGGLELTLAPLAGASEVTLICSGAPAGATCSVLPSRVVFSGPDAATAAVRVTTTASAGFAVARAPILLAATVLVAIALLLFRRGRPRTGAGMASAALVLLMIGCGGGAGTSPLGPQRAGTPAGTYTLTITATPPAGAATSVTVPLKVR